MTITREQAINRLADRQLNTMFDSDINAWAIMLNLLKYGTERKPYNDYTNQELEEELNDTVNNLFYSVV